MTYYFKHDFIFPMLIEGHDLFCTSIKIHSMHVDQVKEVWDWIQDPRIIAIGTSYIKKETVFSPTFEYFDRGGYIYFSGKATVMELKLRFGDFLNDITFCHVLYKDDGSIENITWRTYES